MSCSDTISRTYFHYNVVATYIEQKDSSALLARVLAALYSANEENK